MTKRKDESIEALRGVALILMVAGHVIGANPDEGMRFDETSIWRYIYIWLIYIRMPLFTVISGYVYSMRPVNRQDSIFHFLMGKGRRLLLPLITISTVQYLVQCYMPGINTEVKVENIWRIYFFSYSHFWYLQALFIVFLIIALIDYNNLLASPRNWILILFLSSILFIYITTGRFFSFSRVFYLFPFFILGVGIRRFEDTLLKNKLVILGSIILAAVGLSMQQLEYFNIIDLNTDRRSLIGLVVGLTSTTLFFKYRFKNKLLALIGFYSYGVFLLHLFGSASTRILFESINVKNNVIVFFVSLFLGILIPILFELIIMKNKYLRLYLLGLKN